MIGERNMRAEVIKRGLLDMQVCVPVEWDDMQVTYFANRENMCGTSYGWHIRKEYECPERVKCSERDNFVHIVLDA